MKQSEEELLNFKTIADNASYDVAIANIRGEIVYRNDSYVNSLGYRPEEIVGQPFTIIHNKEQLAKVEKLAKDVVNKGSFGPIELWHTRKDGSFIPMLRDLDPLFSGCIFR